ncbi:hypothetical protein Vretimale_1737 [Volvox reticuliferus]|uniref:Pseudouridine synthase I TruA alpha/beta domain-containing protein n=1 Tax=Volvox reticuliferus TaxID=1737510 RepID=A0A8J4G3L3_9CHLO|nr:hypothetical protein Vretifemale_15376 [Volvox reticuliferus]GIL95794.1 hypothetical protein Vretimale_1737 [Volvox reticuliferus]
MLERKAASILPLKWETDPAAYRCLQKAPRVRCVTSNHRKFTPIEARSSHSAPTDCGAASAGGRCHRYHGFRRTVPSATSTTPGPTSKKVKRGPGNGETADTDDDDGFPGTEGVGDTRLATARRLKMVVAYDGSEFAGFQFQPGKVRTVQGELERCAKRLFHGCSRMVGASRTDGGAHAYGQVVHFDVYGNRDSLESDVLYYNSFLPPDVRVLGLSYAEDGFDSHFSSCGKTYLYKFAAGLPDPVQSKYRWWVYDRWCERSRGKPSRLSDVELDVGLMQQAADMLLGRHDFSAFMDNKRPAGLGSVKRKNPKLAERGIKPERTATKNTRILSHLQLRANASAVSGGQEVEMEVTGNGFLYRMVRMLAAGLVEVGHRRLTPAGLLELLRRADRSALPEAAPPHGLYLARVHYSGDADFEFRIQNLAQRMLLESAGSRSGTCGSSALATTERTSPWLSEQQGRGQSAPGGPVTELSDEAEEVVRELRLTQGQKAAVLMRSAALERQRSGAAGGAGDELDPSVEEKGTSDGPGLGALGSGRDAVILCHQQGQPAGRLAGGWEPGELTQLRDMDREDDQ